VPTVYALPDSEDEEEADRKVGTAEEAARDKSGALRPDPSARLTCKTQTAPLSMMNAEGASKSASASTSKTGGTIHIKKEGAASVKTPTTSTTPNRPTPRAAYCGPLRLPLPRPSLRQSTCSTTSACPRLPARPAANAPRWRFILKVDHLQWRPSNSSRNLPRYVF
jgi:hypothetical protein